MKRTWYKQDAEQLEDGSLDVLRQQHGHEAVTALLAINSYLMHRQDYTFRLDKLLSVAARYEVSVEVLEAVINKLFTIDGDTIFSKQIKEDMGNYDRRIATSSKGGLKTQELRRLKNSESAFEAEKSS